MQWALILILIWFHYFKACRQKAREQHVSRTPLLLEIMRNQMSRFSLQSRQASIGTSFSCPCSSSSYYNFFFLKRHQWNIKAELMGLFSCTAINGWEQRRKMRALGFVCQPWFQRKSQTFAAGSPWSPLVLARTTTPRRHHGDLSPARQTNQGQVSTLRESCLFKRAYLHRRSETHADGRNRCCVGVQPLTDLQVLVPFSSGVLASVGFLRTL